MAKAGLPPREWESAVRSALIAALFATLFSLAGTGFAAPYACPPPLNDSTVACTFASPGGTTTFVVNVTASASANELADASLSLDMTLDTQPCDSRPTIIIPPTTSGQVSGSCRFSVTSRRPVTLLALAQSRNALEAAITLEATSVAFVPEYALTVSTVGNGTVASTDGRVNCGYDCAVVYAADTRVTLTASAAAGSLFGGWQGACDAVATTCTVMMSASRHVTAIFTPESTPPVVEFHNAVLDHYFITAEPAEAAAIDAGSAGPGWSRTGLSFKQGGDTPVCRYYGSVAPGPNSHFYSAFVEECSLLAQLEAATPDGQRRWNFEGDGFVTSLPLNGGCRSGTVPVHRAYNNGFLLGKDANHRFSTDAVAIQQVLARGWIYEGVAMCAPQ